MFESWVNAAKSVSINEVVRDVMNAHQSDIIRLNQEQLMQGVKSSGERLSSYTAPYARRKGKPRNPKTLKDTGDFHKSIYSKAFLKSTEVGSTDSKASYIEDQESFKSTHDPDNIYGLTEESLNRLLDEFGVREEIINLYNERLRAA